MKVIRTDDNRKRTYCCDGLVNKTSGTISPSITEVHIAIDSDMEFKL